MSFSRSVSIPSPTQIDRKNDCATSSRSRRNFEAIVRGVLNVIRLGEVEFARRMVSVSVEPDLSPVVGFAAVDVEIHVAVGHWGDPEQLSVRKGSQVEPGFHVPVQASTVPQRGKLGRTTVSASPQSFFEERVNIRTF